MQQEESGNMGGNFNLLVCEAQAQGQFDTLKAAALRGSTPRTDIIQPLSVCTRGACCRKDVQATVLL